MSRNFRRCCLVTAEEGYQEDAPRKQVEKAMKKRKEYEATRIRKEIAQTVVVGIKEKASATTEQSVKKNWDCSQIEYEEEEEFWQKEDQMDVQ